MLSENSHSQLRFVIVAWLAVGAAIISTSCGGSSGGGGSNPTPPVPATQVVPASINRPSAPIRRPPRPRKVNDTMTDPVDPTDPTVSTEPPPEAAPATPPEGLAPAPATGSTAQGPAPRGLAPRSLSTPESETLIPKVFTAAANDNLRSQIQAIVDSENTQASEAANAKFAAELSKATFEINQSTRQGHLRLLQEEDLSHRFEINMFGAVDEHFHSEMRGGDNSLQYTAHAECLDLNSVHYSYCDTVHVKVRHDSGSIHRSAHILIRRTNVSIYTDGQALRVSRNPGYDNFRLVMENTAFYHARKLRQPGGERATEVNRVVSAVLQTSETFGGATTFKFDLNFFVATVTSFQKLDFQGMLLAAGPGRNSTLLEPIAANNPGPDLISDSVKEARLIANDGAGKIVIDYKIRAATAGAVEDDILMEITRVPTPSRAPSVLP